MTMRRRLVAILVATLALLLTSCAESDVAQVPEDSGQTQTEEVPENVATQQPQEAGEFSGDVNVLNQIGDGQQVVVSRATTDDATRAFVVIYDDVDGAPGAPIGHGQVPAAAEGNLSIELDEPLEEMGSHRLWAVIHIDADPTGEFEPGVDQAMTADGDEVRDEFAYTVTSS